MAKWAAVVTIWGAVVLVGMIAWFAYDLPDINRVAAPERRAAVTLLAADGAPIARYGDLTGETVRAADLPPYLVGAVLAIEDRRFYHHYGIDPIGLLRALVRNIRSGWMVEGGSTITQQLAKNLFLTPERTLRRKIQEMLLAVWLEANYAKEEILTAYLNRVYLGAGTYGIDAAARTYFGVPATAVTLRQAAILAGLLKAPSRYSPATAPDLAEARAATVLAAMVEAGFISQDAVTRADSVAPLPRRRPGTGQNGRYFADWVADQVPDFVGLAAADLEVTTTLDATLQRAAEAIVAERLAVAGAGGPTQAALVALTPDGAVRAMVGGRSYADSQFNRAVQARRQPGSAFKPIVYLAALEHGLRPDTIVRDAPLRVGGWSPENFEGVYRGDITATEALAHSANTATVRVLERAGIDNVIALARRLGITTELHRELSLALGTSEVTLLELTGAYASFADRGNAVLPHAIETVRNRNGEVVYRRTGGGLGEVVRPWHVAELNGMLAQVLEAGTGHAARLDRPAAGKTGTTQDYRDAWFVGFTADLVVGVWVGNDDGAPMHRVTGGTIPARIWRDVMMAAHRGRPPRPLPGFAPAAQGAAPAAAAGSAAPAQGEPDRVGFEGLLQRLLGN